MNKRCGFLVLFSLLTLTTMAELPHKNSSVLAQGLWYKLAVTRTGIHQITYADLESMGVDMAILDPAQIRLFGNGGGMLPETVSAKRYDDLKENSIRVVDGGDGSFDPGDYILFYGEGPDKWIFDNTNRLFSHQKNLYSDTTYYFINPGSEPGLRVQPLESTTALPNYIALKFDDYVAHETEQLSLIRSGKEWYGEVFDNATTVQDFSFSFPNTDTLSPLRLRSHVAARAGSSSYFVIIHEGRRIDSLKVDATDPGDLSRFGKLKTKQTTILKPREDQTIRLEYSLPYTNSLGWLNYLELNCVRSLSWIGPQMPFRSSYSYATGRVTQFSIFKANPEIVVWDVTDPGAIGALQSVLADSLLSFRLHTDSLRQFIAFDGSYYCPVIPHGPIPNQNLHALEPTTLVIVSHPRFLSQADQLADYHRTHNNISVQVVTTTAIFTEFACGNPDPTAIRDFMKLLYDRGDSLSAPRYLLLFGDGSYDPKNRIPGNNNFVPTFQSAESLSPTESYVTDDYFGIMGDNSGLNSNGAINIGVGRFPVSDEETAQALIEKIFLYGANTYPGTSDWRNTITFLADDENQNLHFHQAEELAAIVGAQYPLFNVNKIYFDAYQRVQIPGGYRFPDATRALNETIEKGSLIVNYTGHGGEAGWSSEQVLTVGDIEQWSNRFKLPVFFTATCEFSRFDNPERYTAGEMVILHPEGGAVALFSTTRLAFAGHNIKLNTSFFQHLMDKDEQGNYLRAGDLIRLSKNLNNNITSLRNFVLLGDPVQNIAFADHNLKTISINDQAVNQPDTIRGLSTVTVKGIVEDAMGQKVTSFNGVVTGSVYDKPATFSTLGNIPPPETYPEPFGLQNSLLFKGDAPVVAGDFEFTFVLPRGISLQFGRGKLSYYAYSDQSNAAGYSDQMVIGGINPDVNPENEGPAIALYLNDRNFLSGNRTNCDPVVIADIFDTNGVNYIGLGIGHEIEAVLDYDRAHAIVLNDCYSPAFNSYARGSLTYPLTGLADGMHHLSIKAWDMFDNSSETEISFYVFQQNTLTVKQVMNIPNPVTDHTWFVFQPQQSVSEALDVLIQIYDLTGRPVKELTGYWPGQGQGSLELSRVFWDGTDAHGNLLTAGLYPYRVVFKGKTGAWSEVSQKLVILR